jgi:Xaa-Pro dipeptidase
MFDRAEYLARVSRAAALAVEAQLDALLILDFTHLHWLTGYDGDTAYLTQALLIQPGEEEPDLWVREQDWNGARQSVFMSEARTHFYPERYVGGDLHPFEHIGAAIAELGLSRARIGIEMGDGNYTVPAAARLSSALPNVHFTDIGDGIGRLRSCKSDTELHYMRQAGALVDRTMAAAIDAIGAGVREADVAAVIAATRIAGMEDYAGGWPGSFNYMPCGIRTNTPHLPWGDGRLQPGMGVNLEIGAARHRYVAALSRTAFVGEPPLSLEQLHAATLEGMEAVFGFARPGVSCEELEAVFRRTTEARGVSKNSRIGYGIGVDWIESFVSLQPGDRTILLPGMTFHLMLGMWRRTDGYVLSETFVVTPTGCESLSQFPRRLFVR